MRYSVVLPRIDAADPEAVRKALEQARVVWARGDELEAVELVRAAAEAATAAGASERGEVLRKAADSIMHGLGRSMPPARKAPSKRAPGKGVAVARTAVTAAPRRRTPAKGTEGGRPAAKGPEMRLALAATAPAAAPTAISSTATTAPPAALAGTADAVHPEAPIEDAGAPAELVVTVAPSDWKLPTREALVGRRAVRVAIGPAPGGRGALTVIPLAPGEVAPQGMSVALLVALEPDALPLPRTA